METNETRKGKYNKIILEEKWKKKTDYKKEETKQREKKKKNL